MEENRQGFTIGNVLDSEEIEQIKKELVETQKFKNISNELNVNTNINTDFEVKDSMKFDTIYGGDIITAKSIFLKLDEITTLMYQQRYVNGEVDGKKDLIVATVKNPNLEGGKTITNLIAQNDKYITINETTFSEEEANEIELAAVKEKFEYDEKYYPGKLRDEVTSEAWYSGCLLGGYIWCGEGCGGGVAACKTGAKKGINSLDNACRTHDCCYHDNDVTWKNCKCDKELCRASAVAIGNGAPIAGQVVSAAMCFSC